MKKWIRKLFVERSDVFLKLLDERWSKTEEIVNGIVKVLNSFGTSSGNLLDLCCGNGRISIYMAKKGFKAVGIDISQAFLEDATKKTRENGVSDKIKFVEGDVRKLKEVKHLQTSKRIFKKVQSSLSSKQFTQTSYP